MRTLVTVCAGWLLLTANASAIYIAITPHSSDTGTSFSFHYHGEPGDPEFDRMDLKLRSTWIPRLDFVGHPVAISTPAGGASGFHALLATPAFLGGKGLSFTNLESTPHSLSATFSNGGSLIDLAPSYFLGRVARTRAADGSAAFDFAGSMSMTLYLSGQVVGRNRSYQSYGDYADQAAVFPSSASQASDGLLSFWYSPHTGEFGVQGEGAAVPFIHVRSDSGVFRDITLPESDFVVADAHELTTMFVLSDYFPLGEGVHLPRTRLANLGPGLSAEFLAQDLKLTRRYPYDAHWLHDPADLIWVPEPAAAHLLLILLAAAARLRRV